VKLTRLALFIKFFTQKKNITKLNKIINAGLFLTIFAFISACISFYYETKLNQLEYENTQYYIDIKTYNNLIREAAVFTSRIVSNEIVERESTDLYEYIYSRNLGENLLTNCDLYVPYIFYNYNSFESEGNKELISNKEEYLEYFKTIYNVDENDPIYKSVAEGLDSIEKIKKITDKYLIFYNDIFNYKSKLLITDQTWNKYCDQHGFKIYKDYIEIRQNTVKIQKLYEELILAFKVLTRYDEQQISKIDQEIKKNNSYKFKSIILAFVLQIIVFLIIQSFEILSFRSEVRNVNKSKK